MGDLPLANGHMFQSTLPRGERPSNGNGMPLLCQVGFNPRSHGGSDMFHIRHASALKGPLFQSTLPRGERLTVQG